MVRPTYIADNLTLIIINLSKVGHSDSPWDIAYQAYLVAKDMSELIIIESLGGTVIIVTEVRTYHSEWRVCGGLSENH